MLHNSFSRRENAPDGMQVQQGRYFPLFRDNYRNRWRDVISQHPGHSQGYKSVMAALLKANKRNILFAQTTQNAEIFKKFCCVMRKDCFQNAYILNLEKKYRE